MYELKKMERYLRVNLLGPGHGLTKFEKHWSTARYKKLRYTQVHATKGLKPTITMTELVDALRSMPTSGRLK